MTALLISCCPRALTLTSRRRYGVSRLLAALPLACVGCLFAFVDGVEYVTSSAQDGLTPLHEAAWCGNEYAVRLFLSREAKIELIDGVSGCS